MPELIRLRDLPGVQRVTDLCRNPRLFKYPQEAYTWEEINEISNRLFCIDEHDTYLEEDDPRDPDDYEAHFGVIEDDWEEIRAFFERIGWDVTDGKDGELLSGEHFYRQIIATVGELVDGACFKPDGTGTPAYDRYTGERISDADRLKESLEREAERWLQGKDKK